MSAPQVERDQTTEQRKTSHLFDSILAAPFGLWLLVFFIIPTGIMIVYSFWSMETFQVLREFSLENYVKVLENPLYRRALVGSFVVGLTTATICSCMAFALAWAVRFHTEKHRELLLILIVAASVGSYLARIYSWRSILGSGGLVDFALTSINMTEDSGQVLMFNRFPVILALVNLFLPFAFLPIYASLLTIKPEVIQASRVLGAGPFVTFFRVSLPLAATGLAISFLYVLIFATADFAAPAFLGGQQGVVAAQLIADQFGTTFNWPLGSALAITYVLILGAIVGVSAAYANYRSRRTQI